MNKRLIAIHLPQFHPFPENDEWWGKGFTEWTNVAKARPRFRGHYQPHIPADLGFYDLRLSESRKAQADLAQEYGIYGFCYYHYWFNGHQIMQKPLEAIIKENKPNFPFMVCWANENWTRAWDGSEKQVLLSQQYSDKDDREHIRFLCENYFCDPRYIRIYDKPVFCIYRSTLIPNIEHSLKVMRDEARKKGIELYICRFESYHSTGKNYLHPGFDAAVEFQPHINFLKNNLFDVLKKNVNRLSISLFKYKLFPEIIDYEHYYLNELKETVDYKRFPCVTPRWDNSPRRKGNNFFAFKNSTPERYGKWLSKTLNKFKPYSEEENFVFINAWNEWAEGNHLEPDLKWGLKYLEETKKAVELSCKAEK